MLFAGHGASVPQLLDGATVGTGYVVPVDAENRDGQTAGATTIRVEPERRGVIDASPADMSRAVRKFLRVTGFSLVALLVLAQFVPYGRAHTNRPVHAEPSWDGPTTRELARRACFDCHSNETRWPWYSYVAPASWLVQHDVDEGREVLNFSEWNRPYEEAGEAAETVLERTMPPRAYLLLHPEANLTDAQRRQLADGLNATLGATDSRERE